jgi:hypothetical protein
MNYIRATKRKEGLVVVVVTVSVGSIHELLTCY